MELILITALPTGKRRLKMNLTISEVRDIAVVSYTACIEALVIVILLIALFDLITQWINRLR